MGRINGKLESRSFTISQPPLTLIEERVYAICCRCAADGRELRSQEDITVELGFQSGSSAADVMRRLEAKGYIERRLFQRGRQVMICATGEWTAPPKNTTPHWRNRKEATPAPAIHLVRERNKSLAQMIEAKARALGKPMQEFLMDCVYAGFHSIVAEGE